MREGKLNKHREIQFLHFIIESEKKNDPKEKITRRTSVENGRIKIHISKTQKSKSRD